MPSTNDGANPADHGRTRPGVVLIVMSCILVAGALASIGGVPAAAPLDAAASLGVEMGPVRISGAGHMLDLRYRVVDAKKAAPLFERRKKPYLLDPASGHKLGVASFDQTGPLRNSNTPQVGRRYVMIFPNPGGAFTVGDELSLVVGDVEIEDLVVQ